MISAPLHALVASLPGATRANSAVPGAEWHFTLVKPSLITYRPKAVQATAPDRGD